MLRLFLMARESCSSLYIGHECTTQMPSWPQRPLFCVFSHHHPINKNKVTSPRQTTKRESDGMLARWTLATENIKTVSSLPGWGRTWRWCHVCKVCSSESACLLRCCRCSGPQRSSYGPGTPSLNPSSKFSSKDDPGRIKKNKKTVVSQGRWTKVDSKKIPTYCLKQEKVVACTPFNACLMFEDNSNVLIWRET